MIMDTQILIVQLKQVQILCHQGSHLIFSVISWVLLIVSAGTLKWLYSHLIDTNYYVSLQDRQHRECIKLIDLSLNKLLGISIQVYHIIS